MAIPTSVFKELNRRNIDYSVIPHQASSRSMESSQLAHIDANKLAKGVLLKNKHEYILAVLPASLSLDMRELRDEYGSQLEMASEEEVGRCFPDCELGAVPALGDLYGLTTIVDTSLQSQPDIYFEAGDHEELIHVAESDFEQLLENATYSGFSRDWE